MCNKNSNTSVAILAQVQEFAKNNSTFSIHDITRALRQKTQSGEISIPEFATPIGQFSHNIPHDSIKTAFLELLNDSIFSEVNINLDRNSNGVYFEYKPSFIQPSAPIPTNVPIPTPVVNTTTALNTLVNSVINTSSQSPNIPSIATSNGFAMFAKPTVEQRIKTFIHNHTGCNVTIEQIRAAIRCNGWTCAQIQDIVKNLSISIAEDVYPSKSIVHL